MEPPDKKITELVDSFLTVQTWQDGKKVVDDNQGSLLSSEALNILENRIWEAIPIDDQWAVLNLQTSKRILEDCKTWGINNGFAKWLEPESEEYISSLHLQFISLESNEEKVKFRINYPELDLFFYSLRSTAIVVNANLFGDFSEQIDIIKYELANVNPLFDTFKWACLQNYAAKLMALSEEEGRVKRLNAAIEIWKLILDILQTNLIGESMLWAEVQVNLAMAYTDNRYPGNRFNNFNIALTCFEEALKVYSLKFTPVEWAITHAQLSRVLFEHPSQDFNGAVRHMKSAIEILSKYSEDPLIIARSEGDLATFYLRSNSGDRSENIENSILHNMNALEVFKRYDEEDHEKSVYRSLADAYGKRILGSPEENKRLCVMYSKMALIGG